MGLTLGRRAGLQRQKTKAGNWGIFPGATSARDGPGMARGTDGDPPLPGRDARLSGQQCSLSGRSFSYASGRPPDPAPRLSTHKKKETALRLPPFSFTQARFCKNARLLTTARNRIHHRKVPVASARRPLGSGRLNRLNLCSPMPGPDRASARLPAHQ